MTTLGAKDWLCRPGVEGPEEADPLVELMDDGNLSTFCCPLEFAAGAPGIGAPALDCNGPSGPGSGLFRESTRLDVEEVGVAWAEPAGD